jgi:cell division protein ZapA (FtsZ GTPase activity inhibitor)
MKTAGIKVKIFNNDYNLVGDNVQEVENIAGYVDTIMNRIHFQSPNNSGESIAVVAALNITETLFKEKETNKEISGQYQNLLKETTEKIEELCRYIEEKL